MRKNWNTKVVGEKVVLVPYQKIHVEKYHEWMKSAELQELTGSEPLSLEEEYDMQVSWRDDNDKCTFIVLDKAKLDTGLNEIECMVGDTNIFIFQDDSGKDVGEAEIMIAEPSARGKGFGIEAISLMIQYAIQDLKIEQYTAKIKFGNTASHKLFTKLGFHIESESEVFRETTYSWMSTNNQIKSLIFDYKLIQQPFDNTEN